MHRYHHCRSPRGPAFLLPIAVSWPAIYAQIGMLLADGNALAEVPAGVRSTFARLRDPGATEDKGSFWRIMALCPCGTPISFDLLAVFNAGHIIRRHHDMYLRQCNNPRCHHHPTE